MSEHKEYSSSTKLSGLSAKYILIPSSIILDKDMDARRVSVFSYFSIRKGMDNNLEFSIPSIVKWSGNKPDTHSNGTNEKYIDIVSDLSDRGYLTYSDELTKIAYTNGTFNSDVVYDMCQHESFAILYLDEIYAIMNYKKEENKKEDKGGGNAFFNNAIILLVFAFFRNAIYRRLNELKPEDINIDGSNNHNNDIAARRTFRPEAYDNTYLDISKKLGVSADTISKAVKTLEQLGLIVSEAVDRTYEEVDSNGKKDKKWKTENTIFANTYKREGEYLLAEGEDYYENEISNKIKLIQTMNKKIKRKRKTVKGE